MLRRLTVPLACTLLLGLGPADAAPQAVTVEPASGHGLGTVGSSSVRGTNDTCVYDGDYPTRIIGTFFLPEGTSKVLRFWWRSAPPFFPTGFVLDLAISPGDVSINPTSLTFADNEWCIPHATTLTAAEDDDSVNDHLVLSRTVRDRGETPDVPVVVIDNDIPSVVLSDESLAMNEGFADTYYVRLSETPTASVTVTISGHAGTSLTLNKTSLTFSTTNWNVPQGVTVRARPDDDDWGR